MIKTEHELRCTCHREPMLAVFGIEDGKPYVHVKVYKGRRIYSEVVVTDGVVRLLCRDCGRWYRITIRNERPALISTPPPSMVNANG